MQRGSAGATGDYRMVCLFSAPIGYTRCNERSFELTFVPGGLSLANDRRVRERRNFVRLAYEGYLVGVLRDS